MTNKKGDKTEPYLTPNFTAKVYESTQCHFTIKNNFCCAMLCISAAYAVMRCVCVCLSVTFVDHVKTNKDIFEICSPLRSHTIPVFPSQRA